MNKPRLELSVDDTKRLFHNLRADVHNVFEEVFEKDYPSTEADEPAKEAFRQESWKVVEDEFRMAYEMSRFGLDIQGLEGYEGNLDIFRLNCEDVNGMDPLDNDLFRELAQQQSDLEHALQNAANYRRDMPKIAMENFHEHVKIMNAYYEKLETETNAIKAEPVVAPKRDILNDIVQPELIDRIADSMRENLDVYDELIEVAPFDLLSKQ